MFHILDCRDHHSVIVVRFAGLLAQLGRESASGRLSDRLELNALNTVIAIWATGGDRLALRSAVDCAIQKRGRGLRGEKRLMAREVSTTLQQCSDGVREGRRTWESQQKHQARATQACRPLKLEGLGCLIGFEGNNGASRRVREDRG